MQQLVLRVEVRQTAVYVQVALRGRVRAVVVDVQLAAVDGERRAAATDMQVVVVGIGGRILLRQHGHAAVDDGVEIERQPAERIRAALARIEHDAAIAGPVADGLDIAVRGADDLAADGEARGRRNSKLGGHTLRNAYRAVGMDGDGPVREKDVVGGRKEDVARGGVRNAAERFLGPYAEHVAVDVVQPRAAAMVVGTAHVQDWGAPRMETAVLLAAVRKEAVYLCHVFRHVEIESARPRLDDGLVLV